MVFEMCCGMHFTLIGMLRGKYVPEECRSSVMNLFRVPLNVLVVLVLIFVDRFDSHTVFLICSLWLAAAAGAAYKLSITPAHSIQQVDHDVSTKGFVFLFTSFAYNSYNFSFFLSEAVLSLRTTKTFANDRAIRKFLLVLLDSVCSGEHS